MQSEMRPLHQASGVLLIALVSGIGSLSIQTPSIAGQNTSDTTVTLRLVDSNGRPVREAQAARFAQVVDKPVLGRKVRFHGSQTSDEHGCITWDLAATSGARPPDPMGIYIYSRERNLAAFHEIGRDMMGQDITVPLAPACHVLGTLTSTALQEIGWPLRWSNVYLTWDRHQPVSCMSEQQRLEFWIPPGQYKLWAYGSGRSAEPRLAHFGAATESRHFSITVEPGCSELDLGTIDLAANRISSLIGQPAPELTQIKGWKNGGPVTLGQLRGKFVVLDFWGFWCGPCLRAMPLLMELHDTFDEEGLAIIAVHNDSVDSIAQMDANLEKAREDYWGGRDLPFLVALDGGGRTPVPGTDRHAEGATTAAYGIQSYPTTILIDRQGRILGEMNLFRGKEILQQSFGLRPKEHP